MSTSESLATLLGRLQIAGGIDLVAVVSSDGFLIEAAHTEDLDAEEVAGVATNGLMVAKAIGMELKRGAIGSMIFEYGQGTLMMNALDEELILLLLADPGVNLGRLRLLARRYHDELLLAAGASSNA
jgi:predicted regulator of Ras-like GTPase activity (Roadblock/LC7/MglB family)